MRRVYNGQERAKQTIHGHTMNHAKRDRVSTCRTAPAHVPILPPPTTHWVSIRGHVLVPMSVMMMTPVPVLVGSTLMVLVVGVVVMVRVVAPSVAILRRTLRRVLPEATARASVLPEATAEFREVSLLCGERKEELQ